MTVKEVMQIGEKIEILIPNTRTSLQRFTTAWSRIYRPMMK